MNQTKALGLLSVIGFSLLLSCGLANARDLTFEERIQAQKAIEEVYWRHRSWPKENRDSKPALEAIFTQADLRAKVQDYLAKSSALDTVWHQPITAKQLQGELDRMARDTRDGATLRELFDALENDPTLIAETLVREALVTRLARDFYVADDRFHGAIRRKAETALASCRSSDCLKACAPGYQETTWKLRPEGGGQPDAEDVRRTVRLDAREWTARVERLEHQFGHVSRELPLGTLSALEETADAFVVTSVLATSDTEITTATGIWSKVPFGEWWRKRRETMNTSSPSGTGVFTLPTLAVSACTPGTWSPSAIPAPRDSHTAVWTGSEMIVWGGFQEDYPVRDSGRRYDPATDSWAVISSYGAPDDRAMHTAVWTGTEMIVWGGKGYDPMTNLRYCTNSGGRYNPSTDFWVATSAGAGVPDPRCLHIAGWTGTKMVVWGGAPTPPPSSDTYLNTGGVYDPSTDAWVPTAVDANTPASPILPAMAWSSTELFVWGGITQSGGTYLNTGARYDPSTDSWTATATGANVPTPRAQASAIWTGSEFIVWGGSNNSNTLNTGGRFNPSTGTWAATSLGTNLPSARVDHSVVWTGSEMIIWGGSGSLSAFTSGARYRPSTNSWFSIPSSGAGGPPGRIRHTAVWTGSEMIVWGGSTNSSHNELGNTGSRYSPATNTWASTSVGGTPPPTGRLGHSGVWTGTELIVWGGYDFVTYQDTGGRYNPATDTWSETSTLPGVPAARWFHTAVWTGKDMVVWGGERDFAVMNTGGRYSPASDSWRPTSTEASPGRTAHTGIWTGAELIVWGGGTYRSGAWEDTYTGGRYDPERDTWRPTSTGTYVPQARTWHTAVWTGSEMIVWGGRAGSALLDTGGRYSPYHDEWIETTAKPGVPSAREYHTAIWTGHEMIVWGGRDLTTHASNTGGRYDPRTDKWTPTSRGQDVSIGRSFFDSVWTGEEMVVWGGWNGAGWSGDGGRYNPRLDRWVSIPAQSGFPQGREFLRLVWTGNEMVYWGGVQGNVFPNAVGSYCIDGCVTPRIYHQDLDGDGHGDPTVSVPQCHQPFGYVDNDFDCDDTDRATYPHAPEVKDGRPNACGSSAIDEISGPTVWDGSTFRWSPQVGATGYQVVRSNSASFGAGCQVFAVVTESEVDDSSNPNPGTAFFYLVRSVTPAPPGSWGQRSNGEERLTACLP